MADGTTFKIDGRDVVAKPGQTILQAAMDQDIYLDVNLYMGLDVDQDTRLGVHLTDPSMDLDMDLGIGLGMVLDMHLD